MKYCFLFFLCCSFIFACKTNKEEPEEESVETPVEESADQCSEMLAVASNNDVAKMKELLDMGCDANAKIQNPEGELTSPLRCIMHHKNPEMAQLLLDHGADPNLDLGEMTTPFHAAIGIPSKMNMPVFKLLLENGANIQATNTSTHYLCPLTSAMRMKEYEKAKLLLEKGADPNPEFKSYDVPPLTYAIRTRNVELVKLFLDHGALVKRQYGEKGITALHAAVTRFQNIPKPEEKDYEIMQLLLTKCYNVDLLNFKGETPLYIAAYNKYPRLVDLLIKNGAKIEYNQKSALHAAALLSIHEMIEHLLKIGANPNFKDSDGNTALLISYHYNYNGSSERLSLEEKLKTAEILINHGADPSLKNNKGRSYLKTIDKKFYNSLVQRGVLK